MVDPRYPVGRFQFPDSVTPAMREEWLQDIAEAPAHLRAAVAKLTSSQIDSPYRPGGWTARQVVHHVADSHMNSYIRFRLALTEDEPLVKPYHEDRWAKLADASGAPVDVSLSLLDALHQRWTILLRSLTPEEMQKTFRHPEMGLMSLERNLALYSWHGKHHTAHVLQCVQPASS